MILLELSSGPLMLEKVFDPGNMAADLIAELIHEEYLVALDDNDALLQGIEHFAESISLIVAHLDLIRQFILNGVGDVAEARHHHADVGDAHYKAHHRVMS
jgi:hypothetical protein